MRPALLCSTSRFSNHHVFYLYHHHDLDRLVELLAALLEQPSNRPTLQPDTIIVPNDGVGRWLQMHLAEGEGVAANLSMPLLARFIWKLLPKVLPSQPDSTDYERRRMRWHLYGLLPQVADANSAVANYLNSEPHDRQRLQLADRLADVFDQYLIYRPQLLYDWEQGEIAETSPDRWQAEVWRALTDKLGTEHRARLLQRFIEVASTEQGLATAGLPHALYCFGLGALPPEYVKFLYALAKHIDVHFLLSNPSEAYWGDIKVRRIPIATAPLDAPGLDELNIEQDHPLLASLGRGTRDLLRVLYSEELCEIQEPELGEALAYAPPAGESLLERVQADIIRMRASPDTTGMADDDVSVQVHACHGVLREIQVLQDQLLDLLGRDPTLAPRDIVVMMTRVSDYAPAIHSVFGAARGRHYLPYSVSDRARSASHPIVASFQRLIDLPLSRWAASEILELAAVPAIMRRFGLDDAALATAADWAQQAGVRWGYDASTRARFGAGAFGQNSWQFGLDRILLGLAQSDEDTVTAGVAPWSDLEGGATAALGALWYLVDRLRTWQAELESPASASAWQDRLNAMIDDMFVTDTGERAEQAALNEVHGAIAMLADAAHCLNDEPLDWQAVREALTGELAQPGERQPFLSGGVTFCGLMPLRAVPFKVVCLLGMNDSDFPRVEQNRAFNILRARPRLGDQNVRDDDRLLFLQALTAARSVFYISYTGKDAASGDELPPSPVVGEWLDFLHRYYFAERTRAAFEARLLTHQPMHPFSTRYFTPQPEHPRLFTFAREWQPASRAGHQQRISAPPFVDDSRAKASDEEVIEITRLRRFFDNPARHFLREALAIDLEAPDAEIDDMEPLQLDGLRAYNLRAALLERARGAAAEDLGTEPDSLWRARGVLPPPPLDRASFAAQAEQVNALLPIWRGWCDEDSEAGWLDIDLPIGGQRLTGRIENIWRDGMRVLRPGQLRMQYKLRAWIDYLVYRAAGRDGELRLVGLNKDGDAVQDVAEIDTECAKERLRDLLELYREGRQRPLTFMPELADTFLSTLEKKDAAAARSAVNKKLKDEHHPAVAAKDPYFSRLLHNGELPDDETDDHDFDILSKTISGPLQQGLKERGNDQ